MASSAIEQVNQDVALAGVSQQMSDSVLWASHSSLVAPLSCAGDQSPPLWGDSRSVRWPQPLGALAVPAPARRIQDAPGAQDCGG